MPNKMANEATSIKKIKNDHFNTFSANTLVVDRLFSIADVFYEHQKYNTAVEPRASQGGESATAVSPPEKRSRLQRP